ncbi:LysM peptidoglycan-binding domain-containing protein [Loktanella salsilacus]|uniref:LysM peptidoglycan-binding domain-containing protein n=1 Tax=Loktanella salsilacus TaxID=195913 RepID=UPI003001E277
MANNTARLIGGAGAAVALAVFVIALFPRDVPQVDDGPAAAPAQAADTVPEAAPVMQAAGPTVDTFLLGPDGVAVVAGHAAPGAEVTLLLEGEAIATATADGAGSFATTAEVTASDTPRSLTFAENGAAPSGEAVLVRPGTGAPVEPVAVAEAEAEIAEAPVAEIAVPSERAETAVAEAAPTATETPAIASADAPATAEATAAVAEAPAQPTVVVDNQGARVLGPGPQVMDRVALDAITYDTAGGVQLAGRAPGDGNLQVYVDNEPVVAGPVGPQGDWRVTLPDINAGTYTLRIDEVAQDGTVASRVETPFRREEPGNVAALQGDKGAATQTVQPGNTLWAIARDNLGDGIMYVDLFAANADQIRDPDLIYPGQVFVIPGR